MWIVRCARSCTAPHRPRSALGAAFPVNVCANRSEVTLSVSIRGGNLFGVSTTTRAASFALSPLSASFTSSTSFSTAQPLRGMRDCFPDRCAHLAYVERAMVAVCQRLGFGEIRTPILERPLLFSRTLGEHSDAVAKVVSCACACCRLLVVRTI